MSTKRSTTVRYETHAIIAQPISEVFDRSEFYVEQVSDTAVFVLLFTHTVELKIHAMLSRRLRRFASARSESQRPAAARPHWEDAKKQAQTGA